MFQQLSVIVHQVSVVPYKDSEENLLPTALAVEPSVFVRRLLLVK